MSKASLSLKMRPVRCPEISATNQSKLGKKHRKAENSTARGRKPEIWQQLQNKHTNAYSGCEVKTIKSEQKRWTKSWFSS
jgi:uncharacterized membrane protein YqiK